MELSLILSVALAAAMIVIVLVLVAVIIYQQWQIGDKNATLGRFIDENERMRQKIARRDYITFVPNINKKNNINH